MTQAAFKSWPDVAANLVAVAAGRAPADLVLFDVNQPFVLDRATLKSKSKNTPFDGARLQGRILASFVAGKQVFGQ